MISFVKKFLKMCSEVFCRPCFHVQQSRFVCNRHGQQARTYLHELSKLTIFGEVGN